MSNPLDDFENLLESLTEEQREIIAKAIGVIYTDTIEVGIEEGTKMLSMYLIARTGEKQQYEIVDAILNHTYDLGVSKGYLPPQPAPRKPLEERLDDVKGLVESVLAAERMTVADKINDSFISTLKPF